MGPLVVSMLAMLGYCAVVTGHTLTLRRQLRQAVEQGEEAQRHAQEALDLKDRISAHARRVHLDRDELIASFAEVAGLVPGANEVEVLHRIAALYDLADHPPAPVPSACFASPATSEPEE